MVHSKCWFKRNQSFVNPLLPLLSVSKVVFVPVISTVSTLVVSWEEVPATSADIVGKYPQFADRKLCYNHAAFELFWLWSHKQYGWILKPLILWLKYNRDGVLLWLTLVSTFQQVCVTPCDGVRHVAHCPGPGGPHGQRRVAIFWILQLPDPVFPGTQQQLQSSRMQEGGRHEDGGHHNDKE